MEENQGSVSTVLNAFKPGLFSKDFEVADWTSRVLVKLGYEFANMDLLGSAWDWFSNDNGGIKACILSLKRHPKMNENITSIINQ